MEYLLHYLQKTIYEKEIIALLVLLIFDSDRYIKILSLPAEFERKNGDHS